MPYIMRFTVFLFSQCVLHFCFQSLSPFGKPTFCWCLVDKYDGYVIGPNGELLGPYTNQTHSSENGYANASNAGVSWYADLKGYIGVQPTKLYGSGTFKLAPKSTTTSGSTTLYGHYVHPKAELGLSVNVSSYGSFSISGGSNYDERGSQKTISW